MFDAQRRSGYSSSRRTRTLGILLACAVGLMLSSLALSNVTEEGPATRSIARSLAILTEVDAFLDAEYAELRERASAMAGEVTLADFPVAVSFTAEEVLATDQAGFRELLLSRSAQRVYDDGASVLREGRKDQTGLFSTENVLRRGLELLRPTPHRVFFGLTVALAIIGLVLALGLGLVASAYGRLPATGLSLFLAASPFPPLPLALRFRAEVYRVTGAVIRHDKQHEILVPANVDGLLGRINCQTLGGDLQLRHAARRERAIHRIDQDLERFIAWLVGRRVGPACGEACTG